MSLVELFCHVDDFCQLFLPTWEEKQLNRSDRTRNRATQLCTSEIMTLLIHFHQAGYRDFKTYYTNHVLVHLQADFPNLVSYPRFVSLLPRTLGPLMAYLYTLFGECSGISFVDSTALAVCNNRRIHAHRVFIDLAARGKTSMGWFYGFKLHLIVNDRGELLACHFTPGNIDDRKPVPVMAKHLWGKLFGDRGYISQALMDQLRQMHNL